MGGAAVLCLQDAALYSVRGLVRLRHGDLRREVLGKSEERNFDGFALPLKIASTKILNRFDLVLIVGYRARQLTAAPRRWWIAIATKTRSWRCGENGGRAEVKPDETKEEHIKTLQKHAEVDEPEVPAADEDVREDVHARQVTEEELLRALTSEAQRRAEPQPEPEGDYEE